MNLIRLFFACDRKYVWSKQSILYFYSPVYSLFRTSQMVNKSIFPEEMNVFVIVVFDFASHSAVVCRYSKLSHLEVC